MSASELMDGRRICICAGSGGVGKTTVAGALALGLAARGQRVAVVTIDPARRLADALGLERLGNAPTRVEPARYARESVEPKGGRVEPKGERVEPKGELWAMTLDPKRTFDELVERLAPDPVLREAILGNRVYRELSTAVAGSQEFSAVAKLYELDASRRFDAIVLDTPPSRNALDFLDAPERISAFFGGRALRVLAAPSGAAAAVAARGGALMFGVMRRLTGIDLLSDLSDFFRVLGGVAEGFRARARAVGGLLRDPATTFAIVTSPEHGPAQEAIFLRHRLAQAQMSFGALVVNRARILAEREVPAEQALASQLGGDLELARSCLLAQRELRSLARRDQAAIRALARELGRPPVLLVPQLAGAVSDLAGLASVERFLFAPLREHARMCRELAF